MSKTIQEMLATKLGCLGGDRGDDQTVEYIGTVEAYDKWAEVYDTDGNFLQQLDTIEMRALLPRFLERVNIEFQTQRIITDQQLKVVDLGCGTGRNTIQLLRALSMRRDPAFASQVEVVGVDASPGMLDVARTAIQSAAIENDDVNVSLDVFDLLSSGSDQAAPPSLQGSGALGVISTLVLEHIPLKEFFGKASGIMRSGAYFLVTNMHADMGAISQAGFTDPQTGVKIRPTSYCHSIIEVLAAAKTAGFQVISLVEESEESGVLERAVDEQLAEVLGARAKKWVGINVWFGVCFKKL
ncbi:hypothetical protein N7466_011629 [Penicillium verhagenii]|uniref:uncharacterized protein n=1 Tax=Penicillium verhagenii TaxID=1562060 RepID=UPI0025458833|nr:uncharacterized protein N7466_011629 [Penicillium verhagenii]KAJ5915696.1 hypothetical protein N7466_011629 [Penicillium verhagenii]